MSMLMIGTKRVMSNHVSFAYADETGIHLICKEPMEVQDGVYNVKVSHACDVNEAVGWVNYLKEKGVTIKDHKAEGMIIDTLEHMLSRLDLVSRKKVLELWGTDEFKNASDEERLQMLFKAAGAVQ